MASVNECDFVCGAVGTLIDDLPLVTHATIRPHVIAILLSRGGVKLDEIVYAMTPHCPVIDQKVGFWDGIENCDIEDITRLEFIAQEVLGEMVSAGFLRYNEDRELWVLTVGKNRRNLPKIMNWVSATDSRLPHHILLEMSEQQPDNDQRND